MISPFFEGNVYFAPGIKRFDNYWHHKLFLEFVFEKWKEQKPRPDRIEFKEIGNLVETLGFEPSFCILSIENALSSEEIPRHVQNWLDENPNEKTEILEFLKALGVHGSGSILIQLRQSMFHQTYFGKELERIPETLLRNTLLWMQEKQIPFPKGGKVWEILDKIYARIPGKFLESSPIPCLLPNNPTNYQLREPSENDYYLSQVFANEIQEKGLSLAQLVKEANLPLFNLEILPYGTRTSLEKRLWEAELDSPQVDWETLEFRRRGL